MEIKKELPPNYEDILKVFPGVNNQINKVLFAFGKTIYNPGGQEIPRHLLLHEMVHGTRQGDYGVTRWWDEYLQSPGFRLQEELPAHIEEYRAASLGHPRNQRRLILRSIADRLSGSFYGNLIKYEKAKEMIKKEAKVLNR